MTEPKTYTPKDLRNMLLNHMHYEALTWANLPGDYTIQQRIEGALFSTLVAIDGCANGIPAFNLVVAPGDPSDKQWCIDEEETWAKPGTVVSFMFHEYWHPSK